MFLFGKHIALLNIIHNFNGCEAPIDKFQRVHALRCTHVVGARVIHQPGSIPVALTWDCLSPVHRIARIMRFAWVFDNPLKSYRKMTAYNRARVQNVFLLFILLPVLLLTQSQLFA
jgi:hypothetical protein